MSHFNSFLLKNPLFFFKETELRRWAREGESHDWCSESEIGSVVIWNCWEQQREKCIQWMRHFNWWKRRKIVSTGFAVTLHLLTEPGSRTLSASDSQCQRVLLLYIISTELSLSPPISTELPGAWVPEVRGQEATDAILSCSHYWDWQPHLLTQVWEVCTSLLPS